MAVIVVVCGYDCELVILVLDCLEYLCVVTLTTPYPHPTPSRTPAAPPEYLNVRNAGGVEGLAYDWMTGVLYFTDGVRKAVSAMTVKQPVMVTDIYRNDSMMPRAITIVPSRG